MRHPSVRRAARRPSARLMAAAALAVGALAACVPAQGQTLRERLQGRLEQRQDGGAGQGRMAGRGGGGAPAGVEARTVVHDGQERLYYVHAPQNLGAAPGAVMVFHGGGGTAAGLLRRNPSMMAAADQGGFLAVYPDAGAESWNDGRNGTSGGADDVGFARAVVADLQAAYGLDLARVFATGISSGGMMSHRLACDAPDLVAGIAPVAANLPEALMARCAPAQGTPVMMFSGTDDPLMPFAGGRPELDRALRRANGPAVDQMTSSPDTAAFWARVDGCGAPTERRLPDAASDGTTVTEIDWRGCRAGEVTLFRIDGGGHTWPGGEGSGSRVTGATTRDLDATQTMVNFFSRYGL